MCSTRTGTSPPNDRRCSSAASKVVPRHGRRTSDRVSQYLLQQVIYNGDYDVPDVVLRVLLFKLFNRIETWEDLVAAVGEPTLATFDPVPYSLALDRRFAADERLYSAAYIMPSPQLGHDRKHANHLHLLDQLIRNGTIAQLAKAPTLAALYEDLRSVPSFGPFLAFQYAIDLNYTECFDFDEMDFVVPGPSASPQPGGSMPSVSSGPWPTQPNGS
jgi:hypothetical protein